ncbi:MAG: PAS domain S-box protein [Dehalococcoidia bacterium]|nr:PAS domain S-box protein [Dehalococcoidia bacterium]
MDGAIRKTAIAPVGNVPWGTHFCQFYRTQEDLIETLVPYFKAGLENNEYCMWITSEPLSANDAHHVLEKAMPDYHHYLENGQIEILSHYDWYLKDGYFDSDRVLNGWIMRLSAALQKGFEGLRLSGNTFWLEKKDWNSFVDYEAAVNNSIGQHKIMALCTYSLDKCNAVEIMDVIRNHEFALIKQSGKWEMLENSSIKIAKQALIKSEARYRALFEDSPIGVELYDQEGKLISVNRACLEIFGVGQTSDVIGFQLFDDPNLSQEIKDKLLNGETVRYESYFDFDKVKNAGLYRTSKSGIIYLDILVKPIRFFSERAEGGYVVHIIDISDSKKGETDLIKEKNILRTIMENAEAHLAYLDRDFNFIEVNSVYCRGSNHTREELIGQNHFKLFPNAENQSIFEKVRDTGAHVTYRDKPFEFKGQPERGITYWDWKLSPVNDDSGNVTGLVLSLADTTMRKQRELQLEFQSNILSQVSDAVAAVNNQNRILYWNNAAERIYGFSAAEAIGKKLEEVYQYRYLNPKDEQEALKVLKEQGYWTGENIHVTKTGSELYVRLSTSKLKDTEGKQTGIVSVIHDRTGIRKAEQKLLESEERFRLAAEAAHAMIFEVMVNTGEVVKLHQLKELLGYDTKEISLTRDWWYQQIHPNDIKEVLRLIKGSLPEARGYNIQYRIKHKNGNYIHVESNTKIIRDESGRAVRIIGGVTDITERKKVEQLKDEFIGMVSHEFRTPLTIIAGCLNTVLTEKERLSAAETKQLLEDAADEAELLNHLLGNLLELSKYQAGKLSMNSEPVRIDSIVRYMIKKFKHQSTLHRFVTRFEDGNTQIIADPIRLERILYNLLDNAIKYSPGGGIIRVKTRKDNGNVVVGVIDKGIGIPEQEQGKVFDSFYRLSGTDSKGMGLGLMVCRRLVEAHGGRIWAESKQGYGSAFYFTLPASPQLKENIEGRA